MYITYTQYPIHSSRTNSMVAFPRTLFASLWIWIPRVGNSLVDSHVDLEIGSLCVRFRASWFGTMESFSIGIVGLLMLVSVGWIREAFSATRMGAVILLFLRNNFDRSRDVRCLSNVTLLSKMSRELLRIWELRLAVVPLASKFLSFAFWARILLDGLIQVIGTMSCEPSHRREYCFAVHPLALKALLLQSCCSFDQTRHRWLSKMCWLSCDSLRFHRGGVIPRGWNWNRRKGVLGRSGFVEM